MKPTLIEAVKLVESGMTYKEAAQATGTTRCAVAGAVFRHRSPKYQEEREARRKHAPGDLGWRRERQERSKALLAEYVQQHPNASRQQTVTDLRLLGVTLQVLGDHFGVSREWIRQIEKAAA